MVSFLTNEGQTDLYGSQLAARQCYQIAREAVANQEDASPPEPSIAPRPLIAIIGEFIPLSPLTSLTSFQQPDPFDRRLDDFTRIDKELSKKKLTNCWEAGFIREAARSRLTLTISWLKSKTREQHILHLQEVFYLLRKYDMKLNPSKCAFGVSAGKFLGFMVSQRGIEVSPDQVKAVMETPPPGTKRSYNASQASSLR
ncbi:hypothetical protein CK203_101499 [Vitis vinifera]|uniref:Reverse transcriptase/retrotransposon-derived protein RNase H-like domain-containing protein n=1 Tax=Vitis vinifera TaxID=29760 RepID=A0A438DVL8_VITVI|nr:hypothetical protein CK203_101499 [Vitis vinifera]